jgi:serine/threonine-protein kinase
VRVDGKADVYALGLVLVECATGVVPLVREGPVETLMARLDTPVPVPAELGPLVPLLERMGRPDPTDRPTAGEVAEALLDLASGLPRPEPLPVVGVAFDASGGDDELTMLPTGDRTGYLPRLDAAGAPGRRKVRRRWVLAALVAFGALTGGGAAVWAITRPPTYPVPDVQTQTVDEAETTVRAAMTEAGDVTWTIERKPEYSRTVAKGAVTSQHPAPGVALRDGGTVTLGVSLGPPLAAIPNLEGKTFAEAKDLLEKVRLVAIQTSVNDETVPAGTVVTSRVGDALKPPPQPEGTAVEVLVSSGPAQRKIPVVAGQTEAQLRVALEALQLVVDRQEVFSDTVAIGGVVGTDPPEGAMADRGSKVTISVSKGPDLVAVPDVNGLTESAATAKLAASGLVRSGSFGPPSGKVFATDPVIGTKVKRGSSVSIYTKN